MAGNYVSVWWKHGEIKATKSLEAAAAVPAVFRALSLCLSSSR